MLGITFGALSPRIKEQLPAAVKIKLMDLIHIQKDADAIARLSIRGILSDSETRNARRRVMKEIMRAANLAPNG